MVVTANQPLPCTTRRGDWVMGLALRNKLMYATLHGYKMWWSTELVSSWDLEAAWHNSRVHTWWSCPGSQNPDRAYARERNLSSLACREWPHEARLASPFHPRNKIPLLYILMHPESTLSQGIEWMLWMDDDAIFTDMEFNFPFAGIRPGS